MGGGAGAGAGGRYEKGGQQVGSFFDESADTEKIIAIYGSHNLWTWLRYWFIDTENYLTLGLLDKGYYDYDYETPKPQPGLNISKATDGDKLKAKLARLGLASPDNARPMTADELQTLVMENEKNKRR